MSNSRRVALIGGGVRSGKSDFALAWALGEGSPSALIATAQALDDEMKERIAAHRRTRPSTVRTIEEPLDLGAAIASVKDANSIVVDCLTLWVSNLLMAELDDGEIEARFDALIEALRLDGPPTALVTNEVGLGIVPGDPLSRRFRDLTGILHRRVAGAADEVYLGAMGLLLRLRPGPIEALHAADLLPSGAHAARARSKAR